MMTKKMLFAGAGILLVMIILLVAVYGKNIRTAVDSGVACITQADHDAKSQELKALQAQVASLDAGSFNKGDTTPKGPIKQLIQDIASKSQQVTLPQGITSLKINELTAMLDYSYKETVILRTCDLYPDQCPYNAQQRAEVEQNLENDAAEAGPLLAAIKSDKSLADLQKMIATLQSLLSKRSDIERKISDINNDLKKPICPTPTPTTKPTTTPMQTPTHSPMPTVTVTPASTIKPTTSPQPTIIKSTLPPAISPKPR